MRSALPTAWVMPDELMRAEMPNEALWGGLARAGLPRGASARAASLVAIK